MTQQPTSLIQQIRERAQSEFITVATSLIRMADIRDVIYTVAQCTAQALSDEQIVLLLNEQQQWIFAYLDLPLQTQRISIYDLVLMHVCQMIVDDLQQCWEAILSESVYLSRWKNDNEESVYIIARQAQQA